MTSALIDLHGAHHWCRALTADQIITIEISEPDPLRADHRFNGGDFHGALEEAEAFGTKSPRVMSLHSMAPIPSGWPSAALLFYLHIFPGFCLPHLSASREALRSRPHRDMHARPSRMNNLCPDLHDVSYLNRAIKVQVADKNGHAIRSAPSRRADVSGLVDPFHNRTAVDIPSEVDIRRLGQEPQGYLSGLFRHVVFP